MRAEGHKEAEWAALTRAVLDTLAVPTARVRPLYPSPDLAIHDIATDMICFIECKWPSVGRRCGTCGRALPWWTLSLDGLLDGSLSPADVLAEVRFRESQYTGDGAVALERKRRGERPTSECHRRMRRARRLRRELGLRRKVPATEDADADWALRAAV